MLRELMNQIYDTLMGNVGFSEHHTPFPVDEIENYYVETGAGTMYFEFKGKAYELTLKRVSMEE